MNPQQYLLIIQQTTPKTLGIQIQLLQIHQKEAVVVVVVTMIQPGH